ncbi:alpha-amylase [Streptomyces gobiensis]|uniref:alpha-amylase n=1 Tax=Streptomyces gobiensis TaxID=2875706 RepID=UPI001E42543C|nr:alpha-amylase [Streptomyces gobiensis]UGY94681.1 alpha-amylase [Streptomyces gobiensis]
MAHVRIHVRLRAAAVPVLVGTALAVTPFSTAVAQDGAPPPCVSYASSWRYTFVTNGCEDPQSVQVVYTDGMVSPCRLIEPQQTATFAGYGFNANHPTHMELC